MSNECDECDECDECEDLIVKSIQGEKVRPHFDDKRYRTEYWYCKKFNIKLCSNRDYLKPVSECIET